MRAVGYRVRCLLVAHWRRSVVLGLAVGIVGGIVLALGAGAARTSSAPDRFTEAWGAGFDATLQQAGGPPRNAEVAGLPGVASVAAVTFVFAGLSVPPGASGTEAVAADAAVFAGSYRAVGRRLVEGREPDRSRPEEFVATRSFAQKAGAALGTRFNLQTITQEQADRAGFDAAATEGARGPSGEVTLVGLIDGPGELDDPTPMAVLDRSLLERGPGVAISIMAVGLRPGTALGDLRAQLDSLPDGQSLGLEPGQLVSPATRTAVEGQARGFWLLAAIAALAATVVLGQLITRTVRLSADDGPRLQALGFNKAQVLAESASLAAVAVVGGAVGAVGLAAALSRIFPTGFVRRLEPHPGVRLDAAVLGVGALGLVVALLSWTMVVLVAGSRRRASLRPSPAVEWLALRCRSSALSTGLRFAFTRNGRDRGSVRATVAGMVVLSALLVGALVFDASLVRLVTDGARFGRNYDLVTGSGANVVPDELVAKLTADGDVAALMLYGTGQARVGPLSLGLAGMQPVKGDLAPVTLVGRLPAADDEIALGRLAAKTLRARVGSELMVETDAGPLRFRVTGLAVVPSIEELRGVGQDGLVTVGGLRRADPEATLSGAAVSLRPGAPVGTVQRLFGINESDSLRPPVILNLARLGAIPSLLAALVGGLGVLSVVHVMVTSVRHRRRDVALLRSLGADSRWMTRAVHWQATTFSLLPLALGVPLGLVGGRLVFGLLADSVGAEPSASVPFLWLMAALVAFVVLANAVAAVPAQRARRLAPAPVLAAE